jgi:hypothetical protein
VAAANGRTQIGGKPGHADGTIAAVLAEALTGTLASATVRSVQSLGECRLMSLGIRSIRPALLASLALLAVASCATAANPVSQVGQFEDKSGSILGFFTTEKPNVATIVIQGPKPAEASDKPIMVLFTNKAEWAKFVAMWQRAERSQAKGQATDKIGEYFDADTAAMLAVSVDYQNII